MMTARATDPDAVLEWAAGDFRGESSREGVLAAVDGEAAGSPHRWSSYRCRALPVLVLAGLRSGRPLPLYAPLIPGNAARLRTVARGGAPR